MCSKLRSTEGPFVPTNFGPSLLANTSLATIAVLTTALAIWVLVRRSSAALAPVLLAVPLLLIALFGGPLWEWSKFSGGAGLGPEIRAVPFAESVGATALLWACIGAGLSALLLPAVGRDGARPASEHTTEFHLRTASIVCIWATIVATAVWLIGSGPSTLARDYYLQSDGIKFFLLVGWPLCFLAAIITLVLSIFERDPLLKLFMWGVVAAAYILMTAVGTRMAVAFPAVAALVLIANMVRNRRLYVLSLVAAVALLGLAAFTFSVVYAARVMPHGLLNLPGIVQTVLDRSNSFADHFLIPAKQLMASVVVAYPLTERSAQYDLLDILVANANPLPGTSIGRGFEVYWPYSWVPLAFVGTWFGATGWLGQVLLFCFMGWTAGYTMANFLRSKLPYLSLLTVAIVLGLGALSIQYTSRNVWRVLSIAVVLLVVSYLVRRKRVGSASVNDSEVLDPLLQQTPAGRVREPA
jgi:iron complex transport system permease protein